VSYRIKEMYLTLQGEGAQSGRAAVFCRFEGCNLWSGKEEDRAKAVCQFCDTDFVGIDGEKGGEFETARDVAQAIWDVWGDGTSEGSPYVVFTGGEPLLQLDSDLIEACQQTGIEIGVETNGTLPCPTGIDWICVSPKAGAKLRQVTGQELKIVYPQDGLDPEDFASMKFTHHYLQPMDGPVQQENTAATVDYCKTHPQWKLSLQTHKLISIP
jgi:7-carboxy-7-deazaguanine synthase